MQKQNVMLPRVLATLMVGLTIITLLNSSLAQAQPENLAPGFMILPKGTRIVMMPTDIELFSISGGGVTEPKADWTEAASKHFKSALISKLDSLGVKYSELTNQEAEEFAEINDLHGAVSSAIAMHHFGASSFNLPTKEGKLDWAMGDAVSAIKTKTNADYALFSWVRDSYTSSERVVAMTVMALLGVGLQGGMQIGYASLVDLNTGKILWFNRLLRATGDLREAAKASETLASLMENFPVAK